MDYKDKALEWHLGLPSNIRNSPAIIGEIEKRIVDETNPDCLKTLKLMLAGEYSLYERNADAKAAYLDLILQYPDDPLPIISLASHAFYCERRPEMALEIINRAIEIATKSQNFRRYALGSKARIALSLGAHGIVEDVLRQLMHLKFNPGNIDCGVERDFLDRSPKGAIDQHLAKEYDDFYRRNDLK
jgi:hypothetical protein